MNGDLVLDTSVVVAVLRDVPGIPNKLSKYERLWLPIVALGELELGVELASNGSAQRSALNAFLPAVELLSPNQETARHYAKLKAALSRIGKPVPENDL